MTIINPQLEEAVVLLPKTPKEMLSVSQLDSGKTLVRINSSSLSIIQECMRKSHYSLNERWIGQNESPATLFGSAIHKALEVFYLGDPAARVLPKYDEVEPLAYGAPAGDGLIQKAIAAFVEKAKPLEALPPEDKRSIPNGVWILWHYFKSFIDDPYVALIDEAGRPFVERTFTFTLYEDETLRIDYFGTIDLIVKHQTTEDVLVCDHKTSSIVGVDFYNRLKPNAQYAGYLLGAKSMGVSASGFLVNCLQVKAKPKTSRGEPPHFPRQVTTRDEEDFMEFRESVVAATQNYLRGRQSGVWPLGHINACAQYGGCTYLEVCAAPPALRENILKAKFNKGEKLL